MQIKLRFFLEKGLGLEAGFDIADDISEVINKSTTWGFCGAFYVPIKSPSTPKGEITFWFEENEKKEELIDFIVSQIVRDDRITVATTI